MSGMMRALPLAIALLAGTPAAASVVTFTFAGHVRTLEYGGLPGVAVGDSFVGFITFDSAAPGATIPEAGPEIFYYPTLASRAVFPVVGLDLAQGPSPGGQVVIDTSGFDYYMAFATWEGAAAPPGYLWFNWFASFDDYDGSAFASDLPPLDLPDLLGEFEFAGLIAGGYRTFGVDENGRSCAGNGCSFSLPMVLDEVSVSITDVPEPATLALFGAALIGFAGLNTWHQSRVPTTRP